MACGLWLVGVVIEGGVGAHGHVCLPPRGVLVPCCSRTSSWPPPTRSARRRRRPRMRWCWQLARLRPRRRPRRPPRPHPWRRPHRPPKQRARAGARAQPPRVRAQRPRPRVLGAVPSRTSYCSLPVRLLLCKAHLGECAGVCSSFFKSAPGASPVPTALRGPSASSLNVVASNEDIGSTRSQG